MGPRPVGVPQALSVQPWAHSLGSLSFPTAKPTSPPGPRALVQVEAPLLSATQGPRQPFLSPSKPPATLPTTLLSITVSLQEFKPCAPFLQGLSSSPGHIQPVAEAARSVCIAGLITPFLSLRGFQQCLSTLNHGLQTSGTLTHRKNFILPLILQCTYFCN